MKKTVIVLLITLVILSVGGNVWASSANFNINVEILSQIQLSALNGMDFGRVFKGSAATSIDPLSPLSGTTPAEFQVTGQGNSQFIITLPANATLTNGFETLTVNNFTSTLAGNIGTLDPTGNATFKVGATLQAIDAAAASGVYTGSATVVVAYKF